MMILPRTNRINVIALICSMVLVSGCASLVIPDISDQTELEARAAVSRIRGQNAGVPAYKGIGEISVRTPENAWSVRGAWAGAPDGRFRVEALDLTGQPLAKMICDEDACYFLFSEDDCYRMVKSGAKSLEPLAGVDVGIEDLVLLLGGGIPIHSHDFAWIEPDPEGTGRVLVLAGRFGRPVEKLFFSSDLSIIRKIEVYGWRGMQYRAQQGPMRLIDGHEIPGALWIENDDPAGLQIKVERSWAGVSLSEDLFTPELPKTGRCD